MLNVMKWFDSYDGPKGYAVPIVATFGSRNEAFITTQNIANATIVISVNANSMI
jgi:hypothetical protein